MQEAKGSRGSAVTLAPSLGDGDTAVLWKVQPWEPPAGTFPGASVSPRGTWAKVTDELCTSRRLYIHENSLTSHQRNANRPRRPGPGSPVLWGEVPLSGKKWASP